jgi:hypothetical protein
LLFGYLEAEGAASDLVEEVMEILFVGISGEVSYKETHIYIFN